MTTFQVLAAHFKNNGSVASGPTESPLFQALAKHLLDTTSQPHLVIQWTVGDTFHATHKRAVHVRAQLESYLASKPFQGAIVYVKDPIPSQLNSDGGWDPISKSVYFPVVENGSGHTAQSPTFLLGIGMPSAMTPFSLAAGHVEVTLPNGVQVRFGQETPAERIRELVKALQQDAS